MSNQDLPKREWRKSSSSLNGHCVEICSPLRGGVAVRDSKNPDGPVLCITVEGWTAFLLSVKSGDL